MKTKFRSQKSEVRGQQSVVGGRRSEVRHLASGLWLLLSLSTAPAITPFFYQGYLGAGGTQTNTIYVSQYPANATQFSVYGTNIIFGGNVTNFTPSAAGFASNAIFPGRYRFYITNLNASFTATIPDTTNYLSLSLYMDNPATVSSGVGLNSYQLITNLLGIVPVNAASTNQFALAAMTNAYALSALLGTIATRASNDFALASSLGTIAGRASNDFALATSLGTIAGRASNDFALVTSLGTMAFRGTNEFATTNYAGLEQTIGSRTDVKVITNGAVVFIAYKTNGVPGGAFTNYPQGSIMATTNGGFYRLTNIVWQPIAL